ncbi:forkhead box protein P1-like [Tubulanus polymorphus]|uniref:forkhead box protein P1-like n=1 Tax=Tubulanus polymorphus TaxID=672921 RepID=UPI003DA5ED80
MNGVDIVENGNDSLPMKTKRKSKNLMDFPHQSLLLMQQGINQQQVQQLLQQQLLSVSPHVQRNQQQQSMILQQTAQHKLQEQLLQHLNEQLQMNMLQQAQLLQLQQQQGDKKINGKQVDTQLTQLRLQQHQLVQQIQLQQQRFLLSQGVTMLPHIGMGPGMSPAEIQQLWKEVAAQTGADENAIKNQQQTTNGNSTAANLLPILNGAAPDTYNLIAGGLLNNAAGSTVAAMKTEEPNSRNPLKALYGHGVCKWPGCDSPCDDHPAFLKHINSEHVLDDRSTAQARVQMQVVSQLELQLNKERERLQAMMHHLHMKPTTENKDLSHTPAAIPKPLDVLTPVTVAPSIGLLKTPTTLAAPMTSQPSSPTSSPLVTPHRATSQSPQPMTPSLANNNNNGMNGGAPCGGGPIRRRVSDKCNLPISTEIQRNRDFYKNTDVRPPFTYASLIRQAIIESPNKQLTLNEIYQWFQITFAYFRRNEATWKNAIRTNLSLHKCFVRYEDDFGSFWMVDDVEFVRRRHLTRGRPRKYHESDAQVSMKSTSMPSPTLYGESLNASLRAALAESNLSMLSQAGAAISQDEMMVEDLSMSRKDDSNVQETAENSTDFTIKQEICYETTMQVNHESDESSADAKREPSDESSPRHDRSSGCSPTVVVVANDSYHDNDAGTNIAESSRSLPSSSESPKREFAENDASLTMASSSSFAPQTFSTPVATS